MVPARSTLEVIGNTPVVQLQKRVGTDAVTVGNQRHACTCVFSVAYHQFQPTDVVFPQGSKGCVAWNPNHCGLTVSFAMTFCYSLKHGSMTTIVFCFRRTSRGIISL